MKRKFPESKIAAAAKSLAHRAHEVLLAYMAGSGLVLTAMKLKLDAAGHVEVKDGKPVYIHDNGQEVPFDAEQTVATITRLNGEAMSHRQAKEAAEGALKAFKDAGLDAEAAAEAVKALTTVKNLSTGELKTAAQVQEIKDAAARSAQEAVAAATRGLEDKLRMSSEENGKLTQQLNSHIKGGAFKGSKFIAEKLAIPADIAETFFGSRFRVDNGKLVALDQAGNPLFSSVRHGEHADFEEAIQVFVNQYPNKDMILKGSGASGGGASNSNPGAGGSKSVSRAQFDAMDAAGKAAHVKAGGVVSD